MPGSKLTWKKSKVSKKYKLPSYCLRKDHKEFIKNKKLVLKAKQMFRRKTQNEFTTEVNKITFRANDDNRIQLIDSKETYMYGKSEDLVCKKE